MPEGALTLFTVCKAYRYFVDQHSYWRQKLGSHAENIVIVLGDFFNLMKNVTSLADFKYDLTFNTIVW